MQYSNLQEEELKNRIGETFFAQYDYSTIIGKIDFCVVQKSFTRRNTNKSEATPIISLLWAEAKRGTVTDIYKPLVQLILTIGKARTFDTYLPPPFLAAFDAEKIAFLPYREILPFLALNDFNWNVTPSDTSSREFGLLYAAVRDVLDRTAYIFRYDAHEKELREFIKQYLKVPSKPLPVIKNHRERKGSFFTPKIWVDLSQKYLADVLGENWQDEYYVWDCAAGTGNLLNGLTNKYNIWASTLDQQDVDVMKDRIKNGANLLESHVFQFDFLNDEFTKLPEQLQEIINNPEKRRKLVIYINPPYAEAGNKRVITGCDKHKSGVAVNSLTYHKYLAEIGIAARELYAQFLVRCYSELNSCTIALFSKIKNLLSPNFVAFRKSFQATLESFFLCPSNTFDNVKGLFPISFQIWNTQRTTLFEEISGEVYNSHGKCTGHKKITSHTKERIVDWILHFKDEREKAAIGFANNARNDFQNQNFAFIVNKKTQMPVPRGWWITTNNLCIFCIHLAVRQSIKGDWSFDRDLFYSPLDGWQTDLEFQTNCLAFTLFHGQNRISSKEGINHWIPFTETEVDAKERFESHFMTDFMAGKLASQTTSNNNTLLSEQSFIPTEPLVFSAEATAVFNAGRELWRYYHAQPGANPNASYYDIREHFQGRNDKGKMNPKSEDKEYMRLLANLKEAMEQLRLQIVPKVYEYGFLIE